MESKPNRSLIATTAVAAAAGCFVTWKLYKDWKLIEKEKQKSLPELAAKISAKDLAALTLSDSASLRRSAEQVLVDRMMSESNLTYLLNQCASEDEEEIKKAVTVLSILTKSNEFKPCLIDHNIFEIVPDIVKMISEEFQVKKLTERCRQSYKSAQILKYAIVTVYDLVIDSEANLVKLFDSSKTFVAFLLEIISDASGIISQDVTRLCILMLKQMMQNKQLRVNLLSYGIINRITLCFLRTIGDAWLSRSCLQILVMYINFFEDYVTEEFLQEMAQLGIVPALIGCLKFDDSDLVYCSTCLIHEFLLKDLHRGIISRIPDIIDILYQILVSSESGQQRLVLRILCFLSINDNGFKTKLSNFKPLIKRLTICLASGNNDLVYWALLLVHDLAMMGKDVAMKLIKANGELLKSVIALSETNANGLVDAKLVAETLGFFCSCENLCKTVVEAGSIKSIIKFLRSDNSDLQFWASSLLLNLSMASDEARESIIKEGGIGILLEMAVKESEMPQIMAQASKILVMLGFSDATLKIRLKSGNDSSIQIDRKEYSRMKPGINMVTVNFLNFKVSRGKTYDPGCTLDMLKFIKVLGKHRKNELILLSTQGIVNAQIKDQMPMALQLALELYGLKTNKLDDCGSWCIVAQADENSSICPLFVKQDGGNIIENISISLALQVNQYVRDDLLKPVLNIIMSTPAGSNISKVPELEILSTLARHQNHQAVMISTVGFLDYLAELIWCFACLESDQLSIKPLMIAHCVGALKIVHSLSTNSDLCEKLLQSPVIGAVKSFLFTNCHVFLSEMKQHYEESELRFQQNDIFSPSDEVFVHSGNFVENARSPSSKIWPSLSMDDADQLTETVPETDQLSRNKHSGFCDIEIEALIAQVTSEKTFGEDDRLKDDSNMKHPVNEVVSDSMLQNQHHASKSAIGDQSVKRRPNHDLRSPRVDFENELCTEFRDMPSSSTADCEIKCKNTDDSGFTEKSLSSVHRKRLESADGNHRSSTRSKSPAMHRQSECETERRNDDDDYFEYDEFEEEDLPNLDNEEDNFAASQERLFFDIPRMASVQRLRSASGFNPNDWPTTRSGSLSRTLTEAAQRSKSPLKDIASDLEDFDEALVNLTNYALMTVYFCVKSKGTAQLSDQAEASRLLHILWCIMLSCRSGKKLQFGMLISAIISKLTTSNNDSSIPKGSDDQRSVCLNGEKLTSSMIISNDHLDIYNGNWTFESAQATHCVGKHMLSDASCCILGWYYEVTLFSKGIMQIGWATRGLGGCKYQPEKGLGVGDCLKSIGFDGSRCKIWNGPIGEDDPDNKYGRQWKVGDAVSCLLSTSGEVSFWLNGQDLGIALKNVDTNILWHPALSLSLDQQSRVNFGSEIFTYEPPEGYISIQESTQSDKPSDSGSLLNSPHAASCIQSDTSQYSRGSSSYSSYEFLERSADRSFNSCKDARTPTRKRQSTTNAFPKPSLVFSPVDLIHSKGDADLSEVMYFEVKLPQDFKNCEIEIGYQSTVEKKTQHCLLHGNTVTLPSTNSRTADGAILYCEEVFGCGLLWPAKMLFFTVDGIGTSSSAYLHDSSSGQLWKESLDEMIPYFSIDKLQINFGQNSFLCQAMNSNAYKRKFCQQLYDAVLRTEENLEER